MQSGNGGWKLLIWIPGFGSFSSGQRREFDAQSNFDRATNGVRASSVGAPVRGGQDRDEDGALWFQKGTRPSFAGVHADSRGSDLGLVRHRESRPGMRVHVSLQIFLPPELRVRAYMIGGLEIHTAGMT